MLFIEIKKSFLKLLFVIKGDFSFDACINFLGDNLILLSRNLSLSIGNIIEKESARDWWICTKRLMRVSFFFFSVMVSFFLYYFLVAPFMLRYVVGFLKA